MKYFIIIQYTNMITTSTIRQLIPSRDKKC